MLISGSLYLIVHGVKCLYPVLYTQLAMECNTKCMYTTAYIFLPFSFVLFYIYILIVFLFVCFLFVFHDELVCTCLLGGAGVGGC